MPQAVDEREARRRIDAAAAADLDDRSLRLAVLDEVRRVVPFQAFAWVLTDPRTEVGSAPLADIPYLDLPTDLPRLVRLKYLTAVNRWTALGAGQVATLTAATGGDLSRSLVWRDLLARHAVVDVASTVFRDRGGCWGFLDLWRVAPDPAFSEADVRFLSSLGPGVTAALRRAAAVTFRADTPAARTDPGPAVLLLSPDLAVRSTTSATEHYLERLLPADGVRAAVPAGAYNVAAQLLAVESGVDDHPPRARTHLGDGVWLTFAAARLGDRDQRTPTTDLTVTLELTAPADRLDLFARAHLLTPRESEVLRQLAEGTDTRTTARLLGMSEGTVQDHLTNVFAKTGARSRAELVSRALGA